jgi:predicted phage tail protein
MKEVVLNGFLGEKYGRDWKMKANNIGDVFACIEANKPSFRRDMIEFAEAGGDISIQCGDIFIEDEEELLYSIGPNDIIITPLPAGAKGGASKLLMAALIVGSFFIPGSSALLISGGGGFGALGGGLNLASAASVLAVKGVGALNFAGLALAGVATGLAMQGLGQMMAPDPSVDGVEANDQYLFDTPQNTIAQNNIVPVLFGEMIVGGVIISTATVAGYNRSITGGYAYGTTAGGGLGTMYGVLEETR